jgi:hypothetical protein
MELWKFWKDMENTYFKWIDTTWDGKKQGAYNLGKWWQPHLTSP